ncbi:MAG TPA: hypothetical protein PKV72_00600 [Candidatus Peribacteria bacterium]|nr:hypothetical protein [Candidatus Peribacteria bacterium]
MQFFALETNIDKIRKRYMDPGDEVILTTRFHALKFWLSVVMQVVFAIVIGVIAVILYEYTPLTLEWDLLGTGVLLFLFVACPVIKRYI